MELKLNIYEANSIYDAIEDRLEKLGVDPDNIEVMNQRDQLLKLRYRIGFHISKHKHHEKEYT